MKLPGQQVNLSIQQDLRSGIIFLEMISGAISGSAFDVTANTENTVTVDGSLSGPAVGDRFRIVAKWSLDLLFPDGGNLAAGTEVLISTGTQAELDLAAVPAFLYRSDLGRWINVVDSAVDAGPVPIEADSLVVIRSPDGSTTVPMIAGTLSTNNYPLCATVNYVRSGLDDFVNASAIAGASGSQTADTNGATGESGEPLHDDNAPTTSVWFKYTATQNGALTISGSHSDFDTVLAAYSGSSLANLLPLASTDGGETHFNIYAGRNYYIALDGKAGATGTGYLSWQVTPGTVHRPTGFSARSQAANSVTIRWAVSPTADSYTVYRSTDGTYANAGELGTTSVNSFVDSTLVDGVTYSYWVKAANGPITEVSADSISVRFRRPPRRIGNALTGNVALIRTSDFDQNGVDDLILQNQASGEIGWWHLNDSGGVLSGEIFGVNPGTDWQVVNHGDFNGDQFPDLLLSNKDSGEVMLWVLDENGLNHEASGPMPSPGADWQIAGVSASLEVATQNSITGQIAWQGPGDRKLFNTQPTNPNWELRGLRDFNRDGNSDLFWQNKTSGVMAVWFLNASKNLLSASLLSSQTNDPNREPRGLGDWNGDGNIDVVLQNRNSGEIELWFLDGVKVIATNHVSQQPGTANWEVRNSDQGE